ncbi:TPA: phosphate ABC transporter, permease protein PstA, partial [Clostridioides difficile]|nr:phosphate ABC transporter, permease protein PstA [Clostridioides difficile]
MRKFKENLLKSLVYLSALFTIVSLVIIVGFIFIKGIGNMNFNFLFSNYSASGDGGI